jgi:hypothetical protein
MTSTLAGHGGLCNHIVRNLAVGIIARRHNLSVAYSHESPCRQLGVPLICGTQVHHNAIRLTDDNYESILLAPVLLSDLRSEESYFQTPTSTRHIFNLLREPDVSEQIIAANPHRKRYSNNNDVFVHMRLTDVRQHSPGSSYYISAISRLSFDTLCIASDDFDDPILREVVDAYPMAVFVRSNEVDTIQFGSTCKHVILSHGSFSGVIGLLSFYSDVYYPPIDPAKQWYGDMFSGHGWTEHR